MKFRGKAPWYNSTEDWLEARKGYIGGSNVAALKEFDCHPYIKDECALYANVTGAPEPNVPDFALRAMWWGHRLEPIMAEEWPNAHNSALPDSPFERYIANPDAHSILHVVRDDIRLATSPDALFYTKKGDLKILEIKVTADTGKWKGGIPRHVFLQVQANYACLGEEVKGGYVYALLGGTRDVVLECPPCSETIAEIEAACDRFKRNHLDPAVEPEPEPEDQPVALPKEADIHIALLQGCNADFPCQACLGEGEIDGAQCGVCHGGGLMNRLSINRHVKDANAALRGMLGDSSKGKTPGGAVVTKDGRGAIKYVLDCGVEDLKY